jgi:formylglycine-generating enzyme required for sulfatase activity
MKIRFSRVIRFLSVLCVAVWAVAPRTSGQTPAELNIQLYAGLNITGAVGTIYQIQYVTDLGQTNENDWRCLTYLQLPSPNYLWFDPTAPATGQRFYRATADVRTNMVFIPPGSFRMGSPTNEVDRGDDEGPQMAVTISQGFWMGRFEVTQGEYQAVMGRNPSGLKGDLKRPVEQVSWDDAVAYCAALTQQERTAGRIAINSVFRLPTEAEWDYGCRAWTSTRFSYGDDPGYTNLTNYAWYDGNSDSTTHPVGQKLPNPWGLYDMHGNVLEWCQDWYGAYPGGSAIDPQGPAAGVSRVIRGGGWSFTARYCRSAVRNFNRPGSGRTLVGFRVLLAPGQF